MTEAQIALGRRALACKGWRWREGMLAYGSIRGLLGNHRVRDVRRDREPVGGRFDGHAGDYQSGVIEGAIPVLSNPGMKGEVLEMIRVACSAPRLACACDQRGWRCGTLEPNEDTYEGDNFESTGPSWCASEEEALIASWEFVL